MKLIVINGPPASGKSTLLTYLEGHLPHPLISKDTIKEFLCDDLNLYGEQWSRLLGINISLFVFRMADDILSLGQSVIIEGAFHKDLARADIKKLQVNHPNLEIVEIYCSVDPKVRAQRFAERLASGKRHKAHHAMQETTQTAEEATLKKYEPFNIGTLIRVDTTSIETIDRERILEAIAD